MKPIILEINLKNIVHNFNILRKFYKKSKIAAVVKANAYGLGIEKVSKILIKNKCKDFFVATLEEALELRKINKNIKIYILNGISKNEVNLFYKNNLIPVINNINEYKILLKTNKYYQVALHYDTGMNRLGLNYKEILHINKRIGRSMMKLTYIISHLVSAENYSDKYNTNQLKKINKLKSIIKDKKISLANSAGVFLGKEFKYDMIRPGISLYGGYGNNKIKKYIKNVIKLKAKIIQIKKINKNDTVGYNHTFKAKKNMYIATLAIGYADGISRKLSNKGFAYYKNNKAKFLGNVSMDSIVIDVSNFYKNIKVGNYVELINEKNDIEKMAKLVDTVSQEILTSFGKRVNLKYIK